MDETMAMLGRLRSVVRADIWSDDVVVYGASMDLSMATYGGFSRWKCSWSRATMMTKASAAFPPSFGGFFASTSTV